MLETYFKFKYSDRSLSYSTFLLQGEFGHHPYACWSKFKHLADRPIQPTGAWSRFDAEVKYGFGRVFFVPISYDTQNRKEKSTFACICIWEELFSTVRAFNCACRKTRLPEILFYRWMVITVELCVVLIPWIYKIIRFDPIHVFAIWYVPKCFI